MEQPKHGRASWGAMRRPACLCGQFGVRDEEFEAYYCPTTGTWLESKCSDPNCRWCTVRPDKKELG